MKRGIKIVVLIILFYTFLIMLSSLNIVNAHAIVPSASAVSVDVNGGNPKGSNITLGLNNVFCIEQGKRVRSGDIYTVTWYWEINGNVGDVWQGNKVGNKLDTHTNDANAKLAWILAQYDSGSNMHTNVYSQKQKEIYTMFPEWTKPENNCSVSSSVKNPEYAQATWQPQATAYAERVKTVASITDKTSKANLTKEIYIKNNEQYIKVGPFNFEYSGTYTDKKIYNQDKQEITVKFAKYVGNNLEVYDNIKAASESGKNFYILIPINSGVSKIKEFNAKVGYTRDNVSAQMWILENKDRQNIISTEATIGTSTSEAKVSITDIDLTGSLKIVKCDTDRNDIKLSNVGFKIKNNQNGMYIKSQNGQLSFVKEAEATELFTDSKGEIKIDNLLMGDYTIYETKNPHAEYIIENGQNTVKITASRESTCTITNKRKYIDLSGYVWEDLPWKEGKEEKTNELYQNTADDKNDKKLANVTVRLKEKGKDQTVSEITTDSSGNYTFKKVDIDKLSSYYIEFEYNGMSYQSVDKNLNKSNGSKAEEGTARETFNKKFTTIRKGEAVDENGKTTGLEYNVENNKSTIKLGNNLKYGYNGAKNPVNGVYSQYLIKSNTYNVYGGYLNTIKTADQIRKDGTTELTNINLGLKEREQPDIAVNKDLYKAKVKVGEYNHIYNYADRFTNIATDENITDPTVKFGQKYGNKSYTRALYASDIAAANDKITSLEVNVIYEISLKNESTNLTAVVKSIDEYYDSKYEFVNVGYKVNDGEVEEVIEENNKSDTQVKDYLKRTINTEIKISPQSEQKVYIELKVKPDQVYKILDEGIDVKLDNIVEISSYGIKDKNGATYAGIDQDSQPGNTDVTNQTTWEDDTDKAPGLLLKLQEERKTNGIVFEDDTANEIISGEQRQGDGEYNTAKGADKGINGVKVRLVDENGNTAKVYDKENKKWENAETTTSNGGKYEIGGFLPGEYHLEYTWGGQTNQESNGTKYIYRVQNYKSTIVDEALYKKKTGDLQWYKIDPDKRYSDALDNYEEREEIEKQGQNVTNKVQHSLKDYDGEKPKDSSIISTMTSTTPNFEVNLEYKTEETNSAKDEYELNEDGSIKVDKDTGYAVKKEGYKNELKNIDFGIVRRAKQQLSLEKYVKEAKVVLADGNVLIDAKVNSEGQLENAVKYVSYVPKVEGDSQGQLKVEIDSELIQSATLEITYGFKIKNTSEVEYATEDYYYYGTVHGEEKVITLTPKQLIDYVDNNLSTTDAENWSIIDKLNNKIAMTKEEGLLENAENMRTYLKSVNRILLYTVPENEQKALKPIGEENETTFNVELKATKLLANNSDETFMENKAEIIEVGKTGGSILETTPGNYDPRDKNTYEPDNSTSESLVILPPTGLNTNTIAWIMLALSSLGILTTGIILIKKYVLRK